jgi:hypothetical protein
MRVLTKLFILTIFLVSPFSAFANAPTSLAGADKVDVVIENGNRLPNGPNGELEWNLFDEKGRLTGHSEYSNFRSTSCGTEGQCYLIDARYVFNDGSTLEFNSAKLALVGVDPAMATFMGLASVNSTGMIFNVLEGDITGGTGRYANVTGHLYYRSHHEPDSNGFQDCIFCLGLIIYHNL